MKKYFQYLFLLVAWQALAQKKDTLQINAHDLVVKQLHYGNSSFLVYSTNGKDQPMQKATLVKINTSKTTAEGKDCIWVEQVWEADTIIHKASTYFLSKNMKTLMHRSWWKQKGYTEYYDFLKPEVHFEGSIKDEKKSSITASFQTALSTDFLNWHSDLVLFPLLPLKENRVFKINFYEPGYASPKQEIYEVLGTDKINYGGVWIDCWVLHYKVAQPAGSQRFWISKKSHELLKEEDTFGSFYRYKIKLLDTNN